MKYFVLLINSIVNTVILAFAVALFGVNDYAAIAIAVLIMLALTALAVSPAGEAINRRRLHIRQMHQQEQDRLYPIYTEVIKNTGILAENAPKLYILDSNQLNAFALGQNTIIVTRALAQTGKTEHLEGIIAHELGHIDHGDAQRQAVANILNIAGWAATGVITAVTVIISTLSNDKGLNWLIALFALFLKILLWVFNKIVELSWLGSGRREELAADRYAAENGFGHGLLEYLRKIEAMDQAPSGLWSSLHRTHPLTGVRIAELERFLNANKIYENDREVLRVIDMFQQ